MRVISMARKRSKGAESSPPEDSPEEGGVYSLKIEPDLIQPLKMVAAGFKMSTPNYVNSRLRKIIFEELRGVLEAMGIGDIPPPHPKK